MWMLFTCVAQLPASAKCPILLDKSRHITSLFVRNSHKRVMHDGVKSTLAELRSKAWIVQGGQLVRKLLYECVVCRRPYKAPPPPPLPELRVKEEPPFTYVGVDLVGPLYVKSLYVTVLSEMFGSALTHAASLEPSIWILHQI